MNVGSGGDFMMISAENDNLHNVTLFRKREPTAQPKPNGHPVMVWECNCGCQEFHLHPDKITCAECGEEVIGWP